MWMNWTWWIAPDLTPLLLRRKRRLKKNCKRLYGIREKRNDRRSLSTFINIFPGTHRFMTFSTKINVQTFSQVLWLVNLYHTMGTRSNFYKNPSLAYKKDFSLSSVLQNLRGIILNPYLLAVLLRKFQLATKHCFVC